MNQLGRRQGAVVCGLLVGILLLAGCGSQSNQSANAFDRLSTSPESTSASSFGFTFELPSARVAQRADLTLKQPELSGAVLPNTGAPVRITFESASEAHSQAQTQMALQHECMH